MLNFIDGLKGFFKYKKCLIDNATFRLHYKWTIIVLCIAIVLTIAKQYFGDPLSCIVDGRHSSKSK